MSICDTQSLAVGFMIPTNCLFFPMFGLANHARPQNVICWFNFLQIYRYLPFSPLPLQVISFLSTKFTSKLLPLLQPYKKPPFFLHPNKSSPSSLPPLPVISLISSTLTSNHLHLLYTCSPSLSSLLTSDLISLLKFYK